MPISLTLANWGPHERLEIHSDATVTFVVGRNRRGKTAIRDGLEFVFLGTAELRGIGTKKALAQLLIRDGADEAEVTLENPVRRLRRTVNRKAEQTVHIATRETPDQPWIEERVAVSDQHRITGDGAPDMIRAALEPTAFYALPEARRRELLIGATSGGAPADVIASALLERVPPATDEERDQLTPLASLAAASGFRTAEAYAVEERRKAKRAAKDGATTNRPGGTFTTPDGTAYDLTAAPVERHEERLRAIREEIRAAETTQAADLGAIEGQLSEAEQAWRALAEAAVPKPDRGAVEAARKAEAAVAALRSEIEETDRKIADAKARATFSADGWKRPETCPAVPAPGMRCPVKDATFAKALEAAAEPRRQAQSELDTLQQLRNGHQDALREAEQALEAANARESTETARAAAEKARDAKAAELEARMHELTLRANAARAAAKAGPPPDLAELRAKADLGERIISAKRAFDAALAAYEAGESARDQAAERAERWDAIAKALAPDGIEADLGGDARGAFEADLAELAPIVGPVELDESFALWTIEGETRRHFSQLSESHRLALGIAVQHAFASRLGLPLLVTDAIDRFDEDWKRRWLEAALAVGPRYQGGVLGLATTSTTPGTPPEGCSTVWLKPDGRAVVLGADGF